MRALEVQPDKLEIFKLPLNQLDDDSILQVANYYGFRVGPDMKGARAYLDVIREIELLRAGFISVHVLSLKVLFSVGYFLWKDESRTFY